MDVVRYVLSSSEAIDVLRNARRFNHPWESFRGAILGGVGSSFLAINYQHRLEQSTGHAAVIGAATFVFTVAVIYFLNYFQIRRRIVRHVSNNTALYTSSNEVTFDETTLSISSPTQQHQFTWTTFKKRAEDDNYVYLLSGAGGYFLVIPKRSFTDDSLASFSRCSQLLPSA